LRENNSPDNFASDDALMATSAPELAKKLHDLLDAAKVDTIDSSLAHAVCTYPTDPDLQLCLVRWLTFQKHHSRAMEIFARLLKADAKNSDYHWYLPQVFLENEEPQTALGLLEELIASDGEVACFHSAAASLRLMQLGEPEAVVRPYLRAALYLDAHDLIAKTIEYCLAKRHHDGPGMHVAIEELNRYHREHPLSAQVRANHIAEFEPQSLEQIVDLMREHPNQHYLVFSYLRAQQAISRVSVQAPTPISTELSDLQTWFQEECLVISCSNLTAEERANAFEKLTKEFNAKMKNVK
jgi:tetratricopeptide (TPR) repeat protein